MKTVHHIKSFKAIIVLVVLVITIFQTNAQEEKQSLSVGLMYHKIVGVESFLKISTSYKGENGWKDAANVPFEIVKLGDTEVSLGKGATDTHGKAKFVFPAKSIDSTNSIELRIVNHPVYEDTSEMLDFKEVNLTAKLSMSDGAKQITATLIDIDGNPIVDEGLKVQVKRLIKGLGIGEGEYYTDENGMVVVDIEEDYNSFDGKLIFEVVLEEHDEYGTVRAQMHADFGIASGDLSTYDKRTLWSPAGKTPLFFLIFPNIVLLGILGIFVYLVMNLIKISKS